MICTSEITNYKSHTFMKYFALILISFLYLQPAMAQQDSFGKTMKTESEIKAEIMVNKLSENVTLSPEQKKAIADILSDYMDDVKKLYGQQSNVETIVQLAQQRDKEVMNIIPEDQHFTEYKRCVAEVQQQNRGYGRR